MKYATFNRDHFIWIGLSISIFFLIFYLFSDYKIGNNKIVRLSQIEHLTSSPSCKTFDCSDVKGPVGTTYKKCLSRDPTCKEGQRCSICTSASTNLSCDDDGQCAGDGEEPHGQPGNEGHDVCCPGTQKYLNTWDNDGRNYYKCCNPKSGGGGKTCTPPCGIGMVCQEGQCVSSGGGSGGISIKLQPPQTIQIVNNTTEDPLHVFLGIKNYHFKKISGKGTLYDPVDFSKNAWDPIGAANLSEVLIPKNSYIILQLPPDAKGPNGAFRVSPMKMISDNHKPLSITDKRCTPGRGGIGSTYCKVAVQWPVLLEGGMDVVADSSAVDGINFKQVYQLTSDNGKIITMKITENPCEGLDQKYLLDVGCRNPSKIDCDKNKMKDGEDVTADCPSGRNQVCKFNDCSSTLFNIPPNLSKYTKQYDLGNPHPIVKTFVENPDNLKDNTPLKKFCTGIHKDFKAGLSDITSYCYDYNDKSSSVNLSYPYKMKLIVSDL